MKRNEIEQAYTWDLTSLFPNQDAFYKQYQDAKTILEEMVGKQGHITDTIKDFIAFMEKEETFTRYLSNMIGYANMSADVLPEDQTVQMNRSMIMKLYQDSLEKLNFVNLELIANKDIVEGYLKQEDCHDFQYPMDELFRTIPHRLNEEQELLMAQVNELMMNPSEV